MRRAIEIAEYIQKAHAKIPDRACKCSCYVQKVSLVSECLSTHDNSPVYQWQVEFGGYCFGSLSRHVVLVADSLEHLFEKVKEVIKRAEEE